MSPWNPSVDPLSILWCKEGGGEGQGGGGTEGDERDFRVVGEGWDESEKFSV